MNKIPLEDSSLRKGWSPEIEIRWARVRHTHLLLISCQNPGIIIQQTIIRNFGTFGTWIIHSVASKIYDYLLGSDAVENGKQK